MKKIIILGGGPAGMMAAIAAAESGAQVQLIDQNRMLGRKLLITGKGRCNVTNYCGEDDLMNQVRSNPKFLFSAFSFFNAYDTYAFFEELGVPLKIERGNRVFPESDRAADIKNAMEKRLLSLGVRVMRDHIQTISMPPFLLKGDQNRYRADRIILATGGCSYPLTGSTGDGFAMARSLGHRIKKPQPGLVPLLEDGSRCAKLMGLSLKNVGLSIFNCEGKLLYSDFGEILFTHEGVSGPMVLSASSFLSADSFPVTAEIDLKPALDEQQLDLRVLRDFAAAANRDFQNALDRLLPQKMIDSMVEITGLDPHLKVHQITKEQRLNLVHIIKHFRVKLLRKGSFSEAIITVGGVDIGEIDPKTMASKIAPGLYFAGEILDLDALTGGYNLQIAFSTGRLAGFHAAKENENGN